MTNHIGIVACSAEGAALCYRTICLEGQQMLGEHMHPEVSMHTFPLGQYMEHVVKDDWKAVAELMLASAQKLVQIGAEILVCPDNTIHQAFPWIEGKSPLPWLHIAEQVAKEASNRGFKTVGVLGTRFLMNGPVYPEKLGALGMKAVTPDAAAKERINGIIFSELVEGVFTDDSRRFFSGVIDKLRDEGCDTVVLGCTEIPLLIEQQHSSLPILDSTRILARSALATAIELAARR